MKYDPHTQPEDQVLSDLLNLRNLFSDPKRWIKNLSVNPYNKEDAAFCLVGGIQKIAGSLVYEGHWRFVDSGEGNARTHALVKAIEPVVKPHFSIPQWNDHPKRTHEDILRVIDQAIANRVEEKELAISA